LLTLKCFAFSECKTATENLIKLTVQSANAATHKNNQMITIHVCNFNTQKAQFLRTTQLSGLHIYTDSELSKLNISS